MVLMTPSDALRNAEMPWGDRPGLEEVLLDAAKSYGDEIFLVNEALEDLARPHDTDLHDFLEAFQAIVRAVEDGHPRVAKWIASGAVDEIAKRYRKEW